MPTTRGGRERASFKEAFGFGGLSFAFGGGLGVVSSIVIARLYGIEVVGEFALAYAPAGTVAFLSTARERPALIRELAKLPPRAPRVTGLFAAVLVFSVGLTLLASGLAIPIVHALFVGPIEQPELIGPALVILLGYLLVINTCWNLDSIFIAFRGGRQLFWIRSVQSVSNLALAIGVSFATASVWGVVIAFLGSWSLALIHRLALVGGWMRWVVPWRETRHGFAQLPALLAFGLKTLPGSLSRGATGQAGTWILGVLSPVAAVGAWNRAWGLSQRFQAMNYRVIESLLPTLVERREGKDHVGWDRALVDSMRYTAIAMLLPAAAAAGAAVGVMGLFGPGFSQGSDALAITLAVPPLATMLVATRLALLAEDRPLISSGLDVLGATASIGIAVALTPAMGLTGTALGITSGFGLQLALQLAVVRRHLSQPWRELWPLRQIAGLALACASGFVAAHQVYGEVGGLTGTVLGMGAGCLAYGAVFLAVAGLLPRDLSRLQDLIKRLPRRRVPKDPTPNPAMLP